MANPKDDEPQVPRIRPAPTLRPRGGCHWCEAPVGFRDLFCPGTDHGALFHSAWQTREIDHEDL